MVHSSQLNKKFLLFPFFLRDFLNKICVICEICVT